MSITFTLQIRGDHTVIYKEVLATISVGGTDYAVTLLLVKFWSSKVSIIWIGTSNTRKVQNIASYLRKFFPSCHS